MGAATWTYKAVLFLLSSLVALQGIRTAGAQNAMPYARPEEVNVSPDIAARIQPVLDQFTRSRKLPGSIVMIARHGKIIVEQYSGYDNPNYIFRLFSQSKPITAAATLVCVDKGLFGLDDPITNFIPEFKNLRVLVPGTSGANMQTVPLRRQITIRHLLTHTSGFVYGDGGDSVVDEMYRSVKMLDLWDQDLEGAIIQRASQMSYDVFLQEHLFKPLSMVDTGFVVPPERNPPPPSL
ncbi:beta-lactamase, partial [Nannochloropsis oceanica]